MKHIFTALTLLSVSMSTLLHNADAQTTVRTIRYDGRLEQNGQQIDRAITMSFAIFDSVNAGNQLWPEQTGTYAEKQVTVSRGHFVVDLGGDGMEALNWRVFATPAVYIETKVDGVLLSGRRAIGAVPFAARSDNGVPPGTVIAYMGESLPRGWLWCDGQRYPQAQYPELYAALGSTNPAFMATPENPNFTAPEDAPDGFPNDFLVPDLRGRFVRGVNDMDGDGESAPAVAGDGHDPEDRSVGHRQGDMMRSHLHAKGSLGGSTNTTGNHAHRYSRFQWASGYYGNGNPGPTQTDNDNGVRYTYPNTDSAGNHSHSLNITGSTANTGGPETRPVNVAVRYIIKY